MTLPKIVKDGLTLVGGNAWAQAIAFVAYLVLGRLYTPQHFAAFNIFYSYIEVLIILSTCRYELSIVVADTDREAQAAARLALRLNTVVSLLLLTLIGALTLCGVVLPVASSIALLVPFMVFFCGTTRVYTFLFNRFKRFGPIALSEIVTATTGVVAKIGMAFTALLPWGLPLGTVVGKMAGNVNYLFRLRSLPLPQHITAGERKAVARKFRNFPLYNMPKELVSSFSYNLPFLWLALYFPQSPAVGLFGLALTFTFRPVNIFNSVFEKLLYVRVAEKVREGQSISGDIRRFLLMLNAVALPLFVLLWFFAEPLFTLLFGARWEGIGYYVRCLLPWVYVVLSSSSLSFLANVFGRQRSEFFFYLVLLALRIGAVVYGIVSHDFDTAILLFSLSSAAMSAVLLVWYLTLRSQKQ